MGGIETRINRLTILSVHSFSARQEPIGVLGETMNDDTAAGMGREPFLENTQPARERLNPSQMLLLCAAPGWDGVLTNTLVRNIQV